MHQPGKCKRISSWSLSWRKVNYLLKSSALSWAAPPKVLLLWLAPVPIVPGGWLRGYQSHCSKMVHSSLFVGSLLSPVIPLLCMLVCNESFRLCPTVCEKFTVLFLAFPNTLPVHSLYYEFGLHAMALHQDFKTTVKHWGTVFVCVTVKK